MPKRGRPNIRNKIQTSIIDVLSSDNRPMTISLMRKKISMLIENQVSWNTIEKYLNELVKLDKIQKITLEHSKIEGKDGLTVYTIKK